MKNFDKQQYRDLKQFARAHNVTVVACEKSCSNYNGFTFVFAKAVESQDCRMVHVAVSYCAIEDTFRKKKGKYQALSKFYNGETIQLPLGDSSIEAIINILEDIFYV